MFKLLKVLRQDYLYTLGTGWLFVELISFITTNWNHSNIIVQILLTLLSILLLSFFISLTYNSTNKLVLNIILKHNKKPYYRYDKFGNEIYFNNNKGYSFYHFYDIKGNLLVTYDSDNEWTLYEYDAKGKKTRMVDSHDNILIYDKTRTV